MVDRIQKGGASLPKLDKPKSEPAKFGGAVSGKDNYEVKPRFKIGGITEASDLFPLPKGRFAAVSDRKDKLFIIDGEGQVVEKVDLPHLQNGTSQMEAGTYDPIGKRLYVNREESKEILIFRDFDPNDPKSIDKDPKRIQLLPLGKGNSTNKGIEGMAFFPGSEAIRPGLVVANEAQPRGLFFYEPDGDAKGPEAKSNGKTVKNNGKPVRLPIEIEVDSSARKYCQDFSGVTVDPKTGDLFVSSDESSSVVQLRLEKKGNGFYAKLIEHFDLKGENGKPLKRIEGLAFDPAGNLLLLSENSADVYELKRE